MSRAERAKRRALQQVLARGAAGDVVQPQAARIEALESAVELVESSPLDLIDFVAVGAQLRQAAEASGGALDAPAPEQLLAMAAPEELDAAALENSTATAARDEADETPFDPPALDELLAMAAPEEADEPPFDPPALEELLAMAAPEEVDEPPFDAPSADEFADAIRSDRQNQQRQEAFSETIDELLLVERPRASFHALSAPAAPRAPACEQFVPSISIYASWDRPEVAALLAELRADPRMARAEMTIERGGLDAAAVRFTSQACPDLFILDTTLTAAEMLSGVERLAPMIERGVKVVVLGAINDIGVLRELMARGVSEYVVSRMRPDDLYRIVCGLYQDAKTSQVIAVIGARGGVGASSIAHNLAWSIAERQEAGATLVDLDLPFGTAAFNLHQDPPQSIADLLLGAPLDDAQVERAAARQTKRLRILAAPARIDRQFNLDARACEALIGRVRRMSPFVVLDLPHAWNAWVRQVLSTADHVVVVAGPDLASLRNAKNINDQLKIARAHLSPPVFALSMVGAPQRPEVEAKDFAETLGVAPVEAFGFEPSLFALAEISGQMIGEVAPQSKAALAFDTLATALTGRQPVVQPLGAGAQDVLLLTQAQPSGARPDEDAAGEGPHCDRAAEAQIVEAPAASGDEYLVKARWAAQAELLALQHAEENSRRRPRHASRKMIWAALALLAPILGAAWYLQSQVPGAAEAAPSQSPSPSLVSRPQTDQLAAHYQDALQLIGDGLVEDAVPLLRRAADRGFPMAQYRLAKLYERGEGVPADLAQARQWTERAAAAGNRRAMHDLGVYFARGEGAPLDEAAAFRWFRQAAELGVADSQYNLGVLYQQGRGVRQNALEALFWFSLAAAQGDRQAAAHVSAVETELSLMQVEQVRARARAFQPRAGDAVANGEFPLPATAGAADPSRA